MSDSLSKKIADLRSRIGSVSKNKQNPFFNSKYFDINQLLENLQPHLEELKLGLTQPLADNKVYTIIEDLESGDVKESSLELPAMEDPQKMGSAITYYRRYTLKSLLAIQEEDDDGNKASKQAKEKKKRWLNKTQYQSDKLTNDWKKVTKALRTQQATLKDVKKKFRVNKETEAELESIISNGQPA